MLVCLCFCQNFIDMSLSKFADNQAIPGPSGEGSRPRRLTSDQARTLFHQLELDTDQSDESDWGAHDEDSSGDEAWPNDDSRSEEESDDVNSSTTRSRPTEPLGRYNLRGKGKGRGKRTLESDRSRSPLGDEGGRRPEDQPRPTQSTSTPSWTAPNHPFSTREDFPFRSTISGANHSLPENATAMQYLQLFISTHVVDDLCQQINDYGQAMKQKHTPPTKSSRYTAWTDISRYDIYKFLAVLIVVGMDPRPYISDYWSTKKHR